VKKGAVFFLIFSLLLIISPAVAKEKFFNFGRFGKVVIYQGTKNPDHVVLFVSGDGGWNLGVVNMAEELVQMKTLVVGINIRTYLKNLAKSKERCLSPASDFEELSQGLQKELQFPEYISPVLIGYSSGATLVYAVLVQAPPTTFKGAISLGFCPDLPVGKPFCQGNGLESERLPNGQGYKFLEAKRLEAPWVAFQGIIDQVCSSSSVENFVKGVNHGELVLLPKVGHGFSVERNWLPQFKEVFQKIVKPMKEEANSQIKSIGDLPVVEVSAVPPEKDLLAVIISGDGGWAGIDRELAKAFSEDGIKVVGLNSLRYFWKKKTPEKAGQDLARILEAYLAKWGKSKAILVGYSRGADVLPFMANRLPGVLMDRVSIIALVGLEPKVTFEIHAVDLIFSYNRDALPVKPEVENIKGKKILCFYGEKESDSLCQDLKPDIATLIEMKGGHHFGGDYRGIAREILKFSR